MLRLGHSSPQKPARLIAARAYKSASQLGLSNCTASLLRWQPALGASPLCWQAAAKAKGWFVGARANLQAGSRSWG